jgi:hypothetical protein
MEVRIKRQPCRVHLTPTSVLLKFCFHGHSTFPCCCKVVTLRITVFIIVIPWSLLLQPSSLAVWVVLQAYTANNIPLHVLLAYCQVFCSACCCIFLRKITANRAALLLQKYCIYWDIRIATMKSLLRIPKMPDMVAEVLRVCWCGQIALGQHCPSCLIHRNFHKLFHPSHVTGWHNSIALEL